LSGYRVKDNHVCPICQDNTSYHQIRHKSKTSYIGQRFLKYNHPYRRLEKAFNICQEDKTTPSPLTSEQVYDWVCHVEVTFGKIQKKIIVKNI